MTFTAIVRNGVITLQSGLKLPDGTEVSITPVATQPARLRGYSESDPNFEAAIASFADAEARESDPLEGEVVDLAKDSAAREQFRKLLASG